MYRWWIVLFVFVLAGCQQSVELHRNLSEKDANEVIAELAYRHIQAEKRFLKRGLRFQLMQMIWRERCGFWMRRVFRKSTLYPW